MTDKKLLKTVPAFRKGFLGRGKPDLMCMALSAALQGWLNFLGVETELICGEIADINCNHWWLELPDKRIIDGTGSQFNKYLPEERQMPDVYIGGMPGWYFVPEPAF